MGSGGEGIEGEEATGLQPESETAQMVRAWAPAGTSDSIRARRPAFDEERLFGGARFVLVVSAERGG